VRPISRCLRWAAPAAVVALALAACGSSGSSSTSASSGSTSTSSAPVHGGTMQVAFQSDPDTLPAITASGPAAAKRG
jgi:hypothetical protein